MESEGAIEPDTKDWTWVLARPCPDCGFGPAGVETGDLADLIHDNTRGWYAALDGHDAAVRPSPHVWSPLEYACHVRDVHRLFAERLRLMLEHDDPQFANWDQDVTAVESRYSEQDPATVSVELVEAAADVAALYAQVEVGQWQRPGRRSNGSVFTVETLGVYHLHDVHHHLHDIGRGSARA
jgi:DinB superfamily